MRPRSDVAASETLAETVKLLRLSQNMKQVAESRELQHLSEMLSEMYNETH